MIFFLLLACGLEPPPPPPALKMVLRPVLVVNTGSTGITGETVQVFVHPEQAGPCLPVPTLTATVDGVALTQLHGKVKRNGYDYDRDCDVYEFVLEHPLAPSPEVSVIEVGDGEVAIRAEIPALFTPRTLGVPSDPATTYQRGDEVHLTWTPPGDVVAKDADIGIELRAGEESRFLGKSAVRHTGGEVVFTLPADLPPAWSGPVTVEFRGSLDVQPAVRTCTWAVTCQVSRTYVVEPVTIRLR